MGEKPFALFSLPPAEKKRGLEWPLLVPESLPTWPKHRQANTQRKRKQPPSGMGQGLGFCAWGLVWATRWHCVRGLREGSWLSHPDRLPHQISIHILTKVMTTESTCKKHDEATQRRISDAQQKSWTPLIFLYLSRGITVELVRVFPTGGLKFWSFWNIFTHYTGKCWSV